jgi:hypothetical protein
MERIVIPTVGRSAVADDRSGGTCFSHRTPRYYFCTTCVFESVLILNTDDETFLLYSIFL